MYSPSMRVVCPTSMPATSVIAFNGPGVPSNGTPRSRARGLFWADAAAAEKRTARHTNNPSAPGGAEQVWRPVLRDKLPQVAMRHREPHFVLLRKIQSTVRRPIIRILMLDAHRTAVTRAMSIEHEDPYYGSPNRGLDPHARCSSHRCNPRAAMSIEHE